MQRLINIDALEVCDIVLTTSTAFESKVIRFGTKADISHAMICVAYGSVIDSTSEGVHARNIQKLFYEESCSIHIMRSKKSLSDDEKSRMVDYIRSVIGTPYSVREAVKAISNPDSNGSDLQFCSRLAARAFAKIGINISENPDFCTPAQIKNSPHFMEIPNAFISITDKESDLIKSVGTTLDDMRAVTNKLLELAQKASPNTQILNINNITEALLNNHALDYEFSEAFKLSGYLDHWKKDVEKHQWRYDINLMEEFLLQNKSLLQDLIGYCRKTIRDEESGTFNHWKKALAEHRIASKILELETIRLNAQLYENLTNHHQKRIKTARKFLENHQKPNQSLHPTPGQS